MDAIDPPLTAAEEYAIGAFLRTTAWGIDRQGQVRSLAFFLGRYADLVAGVEDGFDYSIYEYEDDLSTRRCLNEILAAVGPALRTKIEEVVSPLDQRLRVASIQAAQPGSTQADPAEWWFYRIPKSPGPELGADLANNGIVPPEPG